MSMPSGGSGSGVACPQCRTLNQPNSQFCSNCGFALQQPVQQPPMQQPVQQPQWQQAQQQQAATQQQAWQQQPAWQQPQAQQVPGELVYAGFWIRFGAIFIDGIILGIVNRLLGNSVGSFLGAVYYICCWTLMGQTLGQKLLGLRVVDAQTMQNPSWGKSIGRYFSLLLSILIVGIGVMMAGWDPKKQGLHDKMTGTYVIRVR